MSHFVVRRRAAGGPFELICGANCRGDAEHVAADARRSGVWVRVYEARVGCQAIRRAEMEFAGPAPGGLG